MLIEEHVSSTSKEFIFSIVMAVYNVEDYLREAIESIINQDIGFEDNVQLILVDDGSEDNSKNIALEYYKQFPENIIVLSKENSGQASARNLGISYAKGIYLNFLDSDDKLSLNTLTSVNNFFSMHYDEVDMVSIPIFLFERATGPHRLNFKYEIEKVVDLTENPNYSQLSAASAFFRRDTFKFLFDTEVLVLEDTLLINKLLLEKKKYGVVKDAKYWYRQRYTKDSSVDSMKSNKKYYTHRLKYFFKQLIDYTVSKEGRVPYFIQYTMLYDFQWMLKESDLDIFDTQKEIDEFWHYFYFVLNHIDENIILTTTFEGYTQDTKFFLLYLKNQHLSHEIEDNNVFLKAGNYRIDNLKRHTTWIDIVEIKDNCLNISGLYNSSFKRDDIYFVAFKKIEGGAVEKVYAKSINYSTSRKIVTKLNIPWMYNHCFDFKIPINLNEFTEISIKIGYCNADEELLFDSIINFAGHADLSAVSHYSVRDSNIILFENNKFKVIKYSYGTMLRLEYSSLRKMFKLKKEGIEPYFWTGLFYRIIYLICFPFMKNRKIWLFLDRPDFADDNCKHLFSYAVNQKDEIHKYFILRKDSDDFNKIKKIDSHVIPFRSFKHRFLYLFAEKVMISYVNTNFINPFYDINRKFYSGLITSRKYFFPHGITKEDISKYIKKYDKNLALFSASSEIEEKSLYSENYNYDSDVIQVLGLPRHDGLIKKVDNKQILLTPSWREDLKNKDDEYIINTPYFLRLNSLFNNKKLISATEEYGYKLIFKPHPELKEIIHLFDTENITISTDETYQELINPSSLLVTDYSGTFFDFAYLKKPVIYYQGDEDYHYEEGYWSYEEMGFGEVITDEEVMVNTLIEYMRNNCVMKELYKTRVDEFFKFHDKNNCKRAYEWIYNH